MRTRNHVIMSGLGACTHASTTHAPRPATPVAGWFSPGLAMLPKVESTPQSPSERYTAYHAVARSLVGRLGAARQRPDCRRWCALSRRRGRKALSLLRPLHPLRSRRHFCGSPTHFLGQAHRCQSRPRQWSLQKHSTNRNATFARSCSGETRANTRACHITPTPSSPRTTPTCYALL